jgi:outer membrane protein OmpA-like peptidoglycan-associated protein
MEFLYFNNKISGSYDLYSAPLPSQFRPRQVIDVQGIVTDSDGIPIKAYFDIIRGGKSQNNNSLTSNSEDGSYTMVLVEGFEYTIKVGAEGYELYEIPFNLTDTEEYELIEQSIQLKKIERTLILEVRDKNRDVPIDVNMSAGPGSNEEMIQDSIGNYSKHMEFGKKLNLQFSRLGYDTVDYSFTLDMSTMDSLHQIVYLHAGLPQLILTVVDEETNLPLNPNLDLRKSRGRRSVFKDIIRGGYETDLQHNQDFQIRLRLGGYFFHQDTIDLKGIYDGRVINRDIKMIPLKAGNKLTLNNVNFKVNSADLSVDSQEILDEVALLLRQNRSLVIEVGAHSDDLGEESYNKSLSEKRAQSVKDYLITKGVSERALRVKGYGESTPLVPNDTDENRAKNRRVEFSIIRS